MTLAEHFGSLHTPALQYPLRLLAVSHPTAVVANFPSASQHAPSGVHRLLALAVVAIALAAVVRVVVFVVVVVIVVVAVVVVVMVVVIVVVPGSGG